MTYMCLAMLASSLVAVSRNGGRRLVMTDSTCTPAQRKVIVAFMYHRTKALQVKILPSTASYSLTWQVVLLDTTFKKQSCRWTPSTPPSGPQGTLMPNSKPQTV